MLRNYRRSTMDMIFKTILEKLKRRSISRLRLKSICTIGRIEENKGSDRVVEVIRLLHQEGKKLSSLFYRGWGMEEELKKTRQRI